MKKYITYHTDGHMNETCWIFHLVLGLKWYKFKKGPTKTITIEGRDIEIIPNLDENLHYVILQ